MLSKRILVLMFLLVFLPLVGCVPSAPPVEENQAPTITSNPVLVAEVGEIYYYDVEATDPELDTLTYTLVEWPVGMIINPIGGLISWAPGSSQVGSHPVILGVSDGDLGDTQSFIVVVEAVIDPCVPPCPTPDPPVPDPEPEIGLTGITVLPETMSLIVGNSETVESVFAIYDIKAVSVPIPLSYCTFSVSPGGEVFATVSEDGVVTAMGVGIVGVIVEYLGMTDDIMVTVGPVPIIINGILSPNEWDGATEIPIASSMGTVRVLATTDYLYVVFVVEDSTDDRLGIYDPTPDDKIGLNINPTGNALPLGFPYDIIFQTGINPDTWVTGISSGLTDDYETQWLVEGTQYDIPGVLETKTIFNGTRISEWKVPLVSMALSPGDVIKVGGAVDFDIDVWGNGASFKYPIGLSWADPSTYVSILVE